nr:hypothetical protein [Tanacetum cinerariifolium]
MVVICLIVLQLSRIFFLMLNTNSTLLTISHFIMKTFRRKSFRTLCLRKVINSMRIGHHYFNVESDLIGSLLNHDSSIIPSSSKIDSLLDEFAGELTLLKSILPRIDEIDYHPENEIRLSQRLFYDNSSPRPPEEFNSEN